jgi:hypothetical protein
MRHLLRRIAPPTLASVVSILVACGGSSEPPAGASPDAGEPATDGGATPTPDASRVARDASSPEAGADAPSDAPSPLPDAGADAPSDAPSPLPDAGASDDGASACGALPVGGLYATFTDSLHGEVFHVSITNASGIASALASWHDTTPHPTIPGGTLICTQAAWNCPWHWQIVPDTVNVTMAAEEACDGWASGVETHCDAYAALGKFCPWQSNLTELRDCRTDASCPAIPK